MVSLGSSPGSRCKAKANVGQHALWCPAGLMTHANDGRHMIPGLSWPWGRVGTWSHNDHPAAPG